MEEYKGRRPEIPVRGFRSKTDIKGGDKSSDTFETGKYGGEYASAPKGKNPGAKYTEQAAQMGPLGTPTMPGNKFMGNANKAYHDGDVMKGIRMTKDSEEK